MPAETVKIRAEVLEAWRSDELLNFSEFSKEIGCCVDTAKKMLRGEPVVRKVARQAAKAIGVPVRDLVVMDEPVRATA